jgi:hypothetical protein
MLFPYRFSTSWFLGYFSYDLNTMAVWCSPRWPSSQSDTTDNEIVHADLALLTIWIVCRCVDY